MAYVLALDFDGVISDSLLESYLITWRIAGRFDPLLAPDDGFLPTLENIHRFRERHLMHWNSFRALVPFCNRGEDYLLAHRAVREKRHITTQEEFSSFARSQPRDQLDRFHQEFYVERYRLADENRQAWLALNAAYPGVADALEALAGRFTLAVATSKDRESVRLLLQDYGMEGLFEPRAVLDKSAGASKRAHLDALHEIYRCPFDRMTFIDDKVAHLLNCAPLGIRPCLAGWGYNGPAEHELARSHDIPVLKIADLPALAPA
ncbi:MAG: HAD family hydrolase [Candidatus Glassbacteria bacterium]|nr:HAD family hydrolase [Candidatus Glassbacteria bacterium]